MVELEGAVCALAGVTRGDPHPRHSVEPRLSGRTRVAADACDPCARTRQPVEPLCGARQTGRVSRIGTGVGAVSHFGGLAVCMCAWLL
eukprot:3466454-Prymnesium_polylepis.2